MATETKDLEKGLMSATVASVSTSATNNNIADKYTPLEQYQILVGLRPDPVLAQRDDPSNLGKTVSPTQSLHTGLYHRAKDQERRSRIHYLLTSVISHTLYMVQIMLAATFTALSAYKDTMGVTLTLLGAFNTVVAGALAWQKGQGVPQRFRKSRDEYHGVVLDIEMTERAFLQATADPHKLNPRTECDRILRAFELARANQQANVPDLYINTGAAVERQSKDIGRLLEDANAEAAKTHQDVLSRIEAFIGKVEDKILPADKSASNISSNK